MSVQQCRSLVDLTGPKAFLGRQIQARAPTTPLLRRVASPTVARTTKGLKVLLRSPSTTHLLCLVQL